MGIIGRSESLKLSNQHSESISEAICSVRIALLERDPKQTHLSGPGSHILGVELCGPWPHLFDGERLCLFDRRGTPKHPRLTRNEESLHLRPCLLQGLVICSAVFVCPKQAPKIWTSSNASGSSNQQLHPIHLILHLIQLRHTTHLAIFMARKTQLGGDHSATVAMGWTKLSREVMAKWPNPNLRTYEPK